MRSGKKNLVLLVSRNQELFSYIIDILEKHGFDIITAASSAEALSRITYRLPSVIISDTELSNESGYSFCKKIRSGIKTKLIPFIFISDNDKTDDRIKAIQEGADAYLTRPFEKDELLAHVKSKINQFNEFYLLSITDELTRLFNRKEFINKFTEITKEDPDRIISLAIIDLDFFKKVNDIHGHQMGDIVLMKLAELLKENTGKFFFPTRFGGEEFVILLSGIHADEAKSIIESIREKFYKINFKTTKGETFHVSFSAGITEYPSFSNNLSELLSRADQALYAAKKDGRSRTYVFSPIMARNDFFWEYMKKENGYFINSKFYDTVTSLPFLPHLLEKIFNFDFHISSIGVIILRLKSIFDIQNTLGFKIFDFAIENIKFIIQKECENNFASDTYIGISDFFNYEFTILFPSLVDFALNPEKCRILYDHIAAEINEKIYNYGIEISYNSSILYLNKSDPKKLLYEINEIRNKALPIENKISKFLSFTEKLSENVRNNSMFNDFFDIDYIFDSETNQKFMQLIVPADPAYRFICMNIIFKYTIKSTDDLESFCIGIKPVLSEKLPVLLTWIDNISIDSYIETINKVLPEHTVYIAINEYSAYNFNFRFWNEIAEMKPSNFRLCLFNCYISNDILNLLSMCEFDFIIFSEQLTRNIHFFKDRIKLINGFKIFIDQMNIDAGVINISQEEEFHLLKDLKIKFFNSSLY